MKLLHRFSIVLLLSLIHNPLLAYCESAGPAALRVRDVTYEIEVTAVQNEQEALRYNYTITGKHTLLHKDLLIKYQSRFDHPRNLHLVENNKLLITGEEIRSHGNWLALIDLRKEQLEGQYLCYGYWLSPGNRYLACTTWHPRFDFHSQYLIAIHDFLGESVSTPLAQPDQANPEYAFGWIVFPEENVRKKSGDVSLTKGFTLQSPVLWEKNDTLLFFFVYEEEKNYLVMIDISSGLSKPSVFRKYIDVNAILHWDRMRSDSIERFKKRTFPFFADSLELTGQFTIIAHSSSLYYDNKLEFSLDDLQCTFE